FDHGRHHDSDDRCGSDRAYYGWGNRSVWNGQGGRFDYVPHYGYGYGSWDERAIRNGIRNGELTDREVRELRNDEAKIARDRARFGADGVISRREQEKLQDDIEDYRHDLHHELNDGEHR